MTKSLISKSELKEWAERGRKDNYLYMAIVQDLEDKQMFPVYFHFYSDLERYRENIISESKLSYKDYFKLGSHIDVVDDE